MSGAATRPKPARRADRADDHHMSAGACEREASLSSQIALPSATPQFKFKRTKMVPPAKPSSTQAEVVLVGCGAPGRGMGWYHAIQMLGNRCPSAMLCHIVEPWFLGPGAGKHMDCINTDP